MDDVIAAAAVFKEKLGDEYYPYEINDLNSVLTVSLIAAQKTGKDLIDPKTKTVAWTQAELQDAIEFYGMLVDKGVTRSWKVAAADGNKMELYENAKWFDGRLAGSYEWDSTYFKYSGPMNDDQELVPVPILKVKGAVTEGVYRKPSMLFAISKNSDNPEAAAQIVNCMLTEEDGIVAMGSARGLPASAIASKILADKGAIDPTLVAANKIILDGEGPGVSPFNEHPGVREVFMDSLELYAYDEITADVAAQEIIDGINDVMSRY